MGDSSSQSSVGKRVVQSGFSAKDVNSFLQRGNTQASGKTKGIQKFKPTKKTQFTEQIMQRNDSFLGLQVSTRTVDEDRRSGFLGEFASKDFTAEKLDSIVSSFMQREKQIQQGKSQVGRKQLFRERT